MQASTTGGGGAFREVDEAALASLLVDIQVAPAWASAAPEDAAVIVFTKASLERLSQTLPRVAAGRVPVIVLDDSPGEDTRDWVKANFPWLSYHGREEQRSLLARASLRDLEHFLSPLGESTWQLGYCRNYAVVLARLSGIARILMLDDDIVIEDPSFCARMLGLLDRFDAVGSRTLGMPDDSVIGHLQRVIGWDSNSFISGQCMAIRVPAVEYSFPNIYNEDWIFALLQSTAGSIARYSGVIQLEYDPFAGMLEKALFQEFGEVLCDGLACAIAVHGDKSLLTTDDFWRLSCMKRRDELVELTKALETRGTEERWGSTLRGLLAFHDKLDAKEVRAYFVGYAARLPAWKDSLNELRSVAREQEDG